MEVNSVESIRLHLNLDIKMNIFKKLIWSKLYIFYFRSKGGERHQMVENVGRHIQRQLQERSIPFLAIFWKLNRIYEAIPRYTKLIYIIQYIPNMDELKIVFQIMFI